MNGANCFTYNSCQTTADIFTDLEVLSMIKEYDKICIRDGHITIERKTHPIKTAVRRWANNDSRRLTIMQINNLISQSLQLCLEARNDSEKIWTIDQFCKHFTNILDGLSNLKKTYTDDSAIVARLNVISAMLIEEIGKIKEYQTQNGHVKLFAT